MNLTTDSVNFTSRIGLVSWPLYCPEPKSNKDVYLVIGEIYDKNISNNSDILTKFNEELQYFYPFKVKKDTDKTKIYNEEDFNQCRKRYKLTSTVTLYNYDKDEKKIVFRIPRLFNLSLMKPLVSPNYVFSKPVDQFTEKSSHCRVFVVLPYENPILRGEILNQCIGAIGEHKYLFILVGDRYGKNRDATSTLMKRYLLSRGVKGENIHKSVYDKFPDSIVESLEMLPFLLEIKHHATRDLFIASASMDVRKVMLFVKENKISKNTRVRFICD